MTKKSNKNRSRTQKTPEQRLKLWMNKIVRGALLDTIAAHGPITQQYINSAVKRIVARMHGELIANNIIYYEEKLENDN